MWGYPIRWSHSLRSLTRSLTSFTLPPVPVPFWSQSYLLTSSSEKGPWSYHHHVDWCPLGGLSAFSTACSFATPSTFQFQRPRTLPHCYSFSLQPLHFPATFSFPSLVPLRHQPTALHSMELELPLHHGSTCPLFPTSHLLMEFKKFTSFLALTPKALVLFYDTFGTLVKQS